MFGAITVPADLPDGLTVQMFATTADIARQMKEIAADNRRSAATARSLGFLSIDVYHTALARDWSARASDHMLQIALRFTVRSADEALQARHLVATGNARLLEVACAGETCQDCERPLWHHIVKLGTIVLCPFGREYWTLFRAIRQHHGQGGRPYNDGLAKMIARRT